MKVCYKRSASLTILSLCFMFLGIGGIFGGVALPIDPTGENLGITQSILSGYPIQDFVLPGLVLLILLGIIPFGVAYGLWHLKSWAWGAALLISLSSSFWILLEFILFGYIAPFQPVFGLLGLLMLGLCFWPPVRSPFQAGRYP